MDHASLITRSAQAGLISLLLLLGSLSAQAQNNWTGELIQINGTGGNGVSSFGTFVNSATLTIGDIALSGENAIYNVGSFTNTAPGEIRLDRAWGNGIWNEAAAGVNIHNSGLIRIGANAPTGISGILTYRTFINHPGSQIEVDQPTGNAIVVASPLGIFTNAAVIRIGQRFAIPGSGLATSSSATVQNLASASITIDRVGPVHQRQRLYGGRHLVQRHGPEHRGRLLQSGNDLRQRV